MEREEYLTGEHLIDVQLEGRNTLGDRHKKWRYTSMFSREATSPTSSISILAKLIESYLLLDANKATN